MFFGQFRIFRRFLRLDMCNVFKSNNQLIIIRRGWVYNYDLTSNKLSRVLKLKQCRNILHQSMCKSSNGDLYFGEYGMNPKRNSVNIYRSKDKGKSWHVIYSFQKGSIRHVHGCYYDVFSNSIWVLTGDLNNENIILKSDLGFKNIEIIGDGSQSFRAVNLFFTENYVHWIMDSPFKKIISLVIIE